MTRPQSSGWMYILLLCLGLPSMSEASDWTTWRGDSARRGFVQHSPGSALQLAWSVSLPKPMPAWPAEQGKIQFDASYEPIAYRGRLYAPSMVDGSLTAFDLATGRIAWRRYCNAPVRFAPVAENGAVIVASDDGALTAFDADTGETRWLFHGAPKNHWQLGNDRLIRMWPARGAPVVRDGVVYFSAGIWPFMGVFIYAVDVNDGHEIWANSESGSRYLIQQHNSPAFAGIAPQGYLAVNGETLLVSGGRTTPASFDRATGNFLYYRPGDRTLGKDAGGYAVTMGPTWHANHGGVYDTASGKPLRKLAVTVVNNQAALVFEKGVLRAFDAAPQTATTQTKTRLGTTKTETKTVWNELWQTRLVGAQAVRIQTGSILWAEGKDQILAFDLKDVSRGSAPKELHPNWATPYRGKLWRLLATADSLVAVSYDGRVDCYRKELAAGGANDQRRNRDATALAASKPPEWLSGYSPTADGYSLLLGSDPRNVDWLVRNTRGRVVVLEKDAKTVRKLRDSLSAAALLGTRVDVIQDSSTHPAPMWLAPYFADLILCENREEAVAIASGEQRRGVRLDVLRPYGGEFVFPAPEGLSNDALDAQFRLTQRDGRAEIRRLGRLPGASSWTHQNGDIGNTLVTTETRVRAPLGVLWFGGPSHSEVLPRHGHGPTPQVIGGRLFIEGPHMIRAVDVYTGRLLWQRQFENLGLFYDNTGHHPGAGAIGGNYVTTEDSLYVVYGKQCLRLDPATGETLASFRVPDAEDNDHYLGFVGVYDDYLILGVEPTAPISKNRWKDDGAPRFGEGSRQLAVLNRKTGDVLWRRKADWNFRHNAIVAGNGRLYALDRLTSQRLALLKRRGLNPDGPQTLLAMNIESGDVVWSSQEGIFGTWLGYSAEHDILLQAGSKNRDRASDEVAKGMAAYRGANGDVVWRDDKRLYGGPCLLLGDRIITQGAAYSLANGAQHTRALALTTGDRPWSFVRAYGCNTAIGCPTMLTFRSAAAGYYDLVNDSGTGNWGGFRSSCTSNLLPADGVLNAPDYTRTCSCSYQNQCSLALVHMPDVETWTFRQETWDGSPVERLGLNLGAPGDRLDDQNVLWLDAPSVGGPSPDVPFNVAGEVTYPKQHSLRVPSGETPRWIRGSGAQGFDSIEITVDRKDKVEKHYQLQLIFVAKKKGDLRIEIQGKRYTASLGGDETIVDIPQVAVTEKLVLRVLESPLVEDEWMLAGLRIERLKGALKD